ncbi:MAG TPA: M67 family metallopeptidase [Solirubrobacteraceae bacterium]|nr:M67 family metallopeptidase [Solirubrobacteraceae bacterium]
MQIARSLLDEIVEHAVRDAPNECCGVVAARDGAATAAYPAENHAASPFRFEIGVQLADLFDEIDARGDVLAAIYHSHTRSEPYPSQTDVNFATPLLTGIEWLIVGLSKNAEPEVRSYLIDGGVIREVDVEVT